MPSLINGMFIPPEAQIEQFRLWNRKYRLGFLEDEIDAVIEPPAWPDDRLSAVILHWSLDTPIRTAELAWRIATFQMIEEVTLHFGFSDAHLRLIPEIIFMPYTLQWEVINLGAAIYAFPEKARGPRSLHSQGLQAAGYFPGWMQAIDNDSVPQVWLAGYEAMTHEWAFATDADDDWREEFDHAWLSGFRLSEDAYPNWKWQKSIRLGWNPATRAMTLTCDWIDSPLPGVGIPFAEATAS